MIYIYIIIESPLPRDTDKPGNPVRTEKYIYIYIYVYIK